jgi:hypothetical protein
MTRTMTKNEWYMYIYKNSTSSPSKKMYTRVDQPLRWRRYAGKYPKDHLLADKRVYWKLNGLDYQHVKPLDIKSLLPEGNMRAALSQRAFVPHGSGFTFTTTSTSTPRIELEQTHTASSVFVMDLTKEFPSVVRPCICLSSTTEEWDNPTSIGGMFGVDNHKSFSLLGTSPKRGLYVVEWVTHSETVDGWVKIWHLVGSDDQTVIDQLRLSPKTVEPFKWDRKPDETIPLTSAVINPKYFDRLRLVFMTTKLPKNHGVAAEKWEVPSITIYTSGEQNNNVNVEDVPYKRPDVSVAIMMIALVIIMILLGILLWKSHK